MNEKVGRMGGRKEGKVTGMQGKNKRVTDDDDDDRFYIALFSALEQTHCAYM